MLNQPQPKICITTLEFPPDVGGVGQSVHRIARMLQQEGYQVHVAVFRAKHRLEDHSHQQGCQTTSLDGIQVHRLYASNCSETPMIQDYYSEIYGHLKQLYHRHRFDLLHGFFINETGFVTTLLAKEVGIPVINSIRGSDLHRHVFADKLFGPIHWVLQNSDWVTAVSHDLLRRAQTLAPELRSRSVSFWNSIAPIPFDQLPEPPLPHPLQGTVIGCLGRFREKKGIAHLLEACGHLQSQDRAFTLLLVGDFEPKEREHWLAQIDRYDLRERVHVTGMMDRTAALSHLLLMDLFVMPSVHDGCPNALLEAMLSGRAVVGTCSDAIGEILRHQHNGWVIPPGDGQALATALQLLIDRPDLRQRLAEGARQTAQQDLAPAVEQAQWRSVYQQVLSLSPLPTAPQAGQVSAQIPAYA